MLQTQSKVRVGIPHLYMDIYIWLCMCVCVHKAKARWKFVIVFGLETWPSVSGKKGKHDKWNMRDPKWKTSTWPWLVAAVDRDEPRRGETSGDLSRNPNHRAEKETQAERREHNGKCDPSARKSLSDCFRICMPTVTWFAQHTHTLTAGGVVKQQPAT